MNLLLTQFTEQKKNRIVIIPVDEELENEEIKIKENKTLFGIAKVFSRFKKKKIINRLITISKIQDVYL